MRAKHIFSLFFHKYKAPLILDNLERDWKRKMPLLMKKSVFPVLKISSFQNSSFWTRCFQKKSALILLTFCFIAGVFFGSLLATAPGFLRDRAAFPLFFSGIPSPDPTFFSCFSTCLLNLLIFLTLSFLLGMTAFGLAAIPVLTLGKGIAVGLGVSSFLWADSFLGLARSACIYTPSAAASLLLFLLFALRSFVFSDRFRRAAFSPEAEKLDFSAYWKDYLRFLCLAVTASLIGAAFSFLCSTVLF